MRVPSRYLGMTTFGREGMETQTSRQECNALKISAGSASAMAPMVESPWW